MWLRQPCPDLRDSLKQDLAWLENLARVLFDQLLILLISFLILTSH